ncbi:unnamed protein product [Adineta ricciae]|nr:unnamed protein product [Adineta ricciae]
MLLIIAGIILLLFLIKPKSTKSVPSYTPELRWNSTGMTVAGTSSMPGNASHQLNDPADIILDYENNLYIADRKNNRIQKYLFGILNGTTVTGSGIYNYSQYQLSNPARMIMDSNRNLYISDTSYHRIQFWPNNANYTMTVAGITNIYGNSSNQLYYPIGIALHPTSGELYISDQFNHRIMSHTSGTNFSTLLFGGNGAGINNTKLYYPYGLHLDLFSNSLIIANTFVNNIVRYVFGTNTWTLVAGNISGFAGNTSTHLNSPYEAILDPMGNLYVADRNNHRIQFFKAGQSNGITIAGTGANSSSATTLLLPRSLRLDSQLNLYVADTGNHRILKFLRY